MEIIAVSCIKNPPSRHQTITYSVHAAPIEWRDSRIVLASKYICEAGEVIIMNNDTQERDGTIGNPLDCNLRLLPDGGEENENEGNGDGENGNGENNNGENGNSETEENEAEENGEEDEGATILYLDIGEGLFLDLLGLEVDLAEVELDVSAVPGSDKLLGNLLSAVAGLLDGGLEGLLGDLLPGDDLSSLSEMLPDLEDISFSDMFFSFVNQLLDVVLESLEEMDESADANE
jgi:hypothetical protein